MFYLLYQLCDTVIHKKYAFGHSVNQNTFFMYIWSYPQFLAHSSPDPWNFLNTESDNSVFCYVNDDFLEASKEEVGCQENQSCVERVGTFSHTPLT